MNPTFTSRTVPARCVELPVRHRHIVENSTLSALLRLLGAEEGVTAQTDAQRVVLRQVLAGAELFQEGSEAESVGFVHVGSFKLFTTAEDGYQQVVDFAERAEVLGFDALGTGRHPSTAQALEDSWVYNLRFPDLFAWSHDVPALGRAVHLASSRLLAKRCAVADVMAAVAAEVRLARFLVHLAGQMQSLGRSPRHFVLRMSRRDLASQIGVAHETVSRAFTTLAQWGCVRVDIREVEILDLEQLKAFARCTRGMATDAMPPRKHRPRQASRPSVAQLQPNLQNRLSA